MHGGDHQRFVIIDRYRACGKTRRTDDVIFDRDVCSQPTPDNAHLQYPCGLGACQSDAEKLPKPAPWHILLDYIISNNAPPATDLHSYLYVVGRLTAGFKLNRQNPHSDHSQNN
jgi:hypothetical protein